MNDAIKVIEGLKLRLSLELNKGRIPEDTDELCEIADDIETLRKAILILKTHD